MLKLNIMATLVVAFILNSCTMQEEKNTGIDQKVEGYAPFTLTTDISHLSQGQKDMLKIFFEISDIMDELFWLQAYGEKSNLDTLNLSPAEKKFTEINYGPWDRLDSDKPFVDGVGPKPLGANFYPANITRDEFEGWNNPDKTSLYTLIKRNTNGDLETVPYHRAYKKQLIKASELLKKAAALAEDEGFKNYLELRAQALISDDFQPSDMAWMDMKNNLIDFVVGPIENYEDQLFNYKAAYEAYILIKDTSWSARLSKFAGILPELQKQLPVGPAYKAEVPGSNSDLNAYDVIYYTGDCNAASKTIAINLPNDEEVQLKKGSRRLQLKNAMKAKFDKILVPIANVLIAPEQGQNITFDAFFENVMFHEVAHGLGIKYLIENDTVSVTEALKEKHTILEEGKADILGLFLVEKLVEMGELENRMEDNYVTFLAGIFRSIRFGSSSAHGVANLMRFNFFKEKGAFYKNEAGQYLVDFNKMDIAVDELSGIILKIQGDGDYKAAGILIDKYGVKTDELQADLDKINAQGIPVDIVFNQGIEFIPGL